LNAVDEDGWTALMYACSVGAAEAVTKLMANGADASVKNKDGETAMDMVGLYKLNSVDP
jgi:ankyrin repeat protein